MNCPSAAPSRRWATRWAALSRGIIPATWNYETPDPECDLDYVPNAPRPADIQVALKNSFGLGGQNACLVLGRYTNGTVKKEE